MKSRILKKPMVPLMYAFVFAGVFMLLSCVTNIRTNALVDNSSDSDCINVGVRGSYFFNKQEALDRVNEIRREACEEGIKDPRNPSKALTMNDYVPMKWSDELEEVARLRAVEASIRVAHNRPCDEGCFSVSTDSVGYYGGEILAWNYSNNMIKGINQFYGEKYDWVNNTGYQTGHYTMLIDPDNIYIGFGGFYSPECGVYPSALCGRIGTVQGRSISDFESAGKKVTVPVSVHKNHIKDAFLKCSDNSAGMLPGNTRKYELWLKLEFDDDDSYGKFMGSVRWSTSDKSVVSISNGSVTAVNPGTAVITARTSEGYIAQAKITVKSPVKEIRLSQNELTLPKGDSAEIYIQKNGNDKPESTKNKAVLSCLALPVDAVDRTVTWTSSDTKVAKIENGKISAVSTGTAVITAKSSNGVTASCKVKVVIPVSSVTLSSSQMSLGLKEAMRLNATVYPANASDKTIKWRTSNSKVAIVEPDGDVWGMGIGTAYITARSSNGIEKSCKVIIKNAPSSIVLTKGILTIGVGESYTVGSSVNDGAASANRTYRTSNSKIVKMKKTTWTGVFTGVSPGVAYVTVRTYNSKESTCKVTVKAAPTSVTISKKNLTLKVGQKASLSCIIPNGTGCATRTFSSGNSSVVCMTKTNWTGEFKAVRPGTTYVKVRTYNGKESSCKVTVVKN